MPGYPDYSRMPGCMQMRECPDRKPVPGSPDTTPRMTTRILSIAQNLSIVPLESSLKLCVLSCQLRFWFRLGLVHDNASTKLVCFAGRGGHDN